MAKNELFPDEMRALSLIAQVFGTELAEKVETDRRVVLPKGAYSVVIATSSIAFNYKNHDSVTVYMPRKQWSSDKLDPAEVNWSAWGSQSPAEARIFNQMLTQAIKVAEQLNEAAGLK